MTASSPAGCHGPGAGPSVVPPVSVVAVVVGDVGEGGELAPQLGQEPVLLPDGTSQHSACVVKALETTHHVNEDLLLYCQDSQTFD